MAFLNFNHLIGKSKVTLKDLVNVFKINHKALDKNEFDKLQKAEIYLGEVITFFTNNPTSRDNFVNHTKIEISERAIKKLDLNASDYFQSHLLILKELLLILKGSKNLIVNEKLKRIINKYKNKNHLVHAYLNEYLELAFKYKLDFLVEEEKRFRKKITEKLFIDFIMITTSSKKGFGVGIATYKSQIYQHVEDTGLLPLVIIPLTREAAQLIETAPFRRHSFSKVKFKRSDFLPDIDTGVMKNLLNLKSLQNNRPSNN